MRLVWALALLFAVPVHAQSIGAPKLVPDDSWIYQHTVENKTGWHQQNIEVTVLRPGSDTIAISSKPVGSTMPATEALTGADWSRLRSVNGRETLINKPFSFPLSIGKSWSVEYTEDHPNRVHSRETVHSGYKVIGWDDVTVPAGTFHAVKIEGDGQWTAIMAPAIDTASGARVDAQGATTVMQSQRVAPGNVTGRTYKAFWYVPGVKRWVKSVEEYYDANGIRNERFTDELQSYKVAN